MSQEMSGANDASATKRSLPSALRGGRKGIAALLSILSVAGVTSASAPALAQRVTVTIGGYGTPNNGSASSSTSAQPTGNPAGYAQAAWAGAAAYARYMQYVSVLNYQATHGGALPPGLDVHEYFTNGAEALTIPSSSQYFANGSETTVLPGSSAPAQPPTYAPMGNPNLPPTSSLPPPPSSAPPAQSPWVVVMQNPNPQAAPPVSALSSSPPPAPSPPASAAPANAPPPPPAPGSEPGGDAHPPPVAMSFDDWLQSMGYTEPDVPQDAPPPELTSAVVATGETGNDSTVAEPVALAYDVRPRVSLAIREKARSRIVPASSTLGSMGGIAGGFAAGLLLGGLAMLRMRDRSRREAAGGSPPAA